jgi:hypothetical protein
MCFFCGDASAETVYLDELLSTKLATLGDFNISQECKPVIGDIDFGPLPGFSLPGLVEIVCTMKKGRLRAIKPVTVLSSDITSGDPIKSDLPNSFQAKSVAVRNCTNADKTVRVGLNMSTTVNQQLTIANQISTSRTDGVAGGIALNFGWISGNLAGSRNWNRTASTTETRIESEGDTVGESYSMDIVVKPMTIQVVTGKWTGSEVQIPWRAAFIVDATLATNLAHKRKASQLLNETERRIEASGVLRGFELGDVAISFDDEALNDQYCNGVPLDQKFMASPEVVGEVSLQ